MSLRLLILSALLAVSQLVAAAGKGEQVPAQEPQLGADTVHGCYKSVGSLVKNGTDNTFMSQGKCVDWCRGSQRYVGATQAGDCYCGDKYPPKNTLTFDTDCNEPCGGYGDQACGGLDTWTVYNTGLRAAVGDDANVTQSSSTPGGGHGPSSTSKPTVVTAPGSVVTETPKDSNSSNGKGTNTVGIAVGVVVGVVALMAIVGVVVFFMKRRRNAEIEEEHRRNAAVNSFIGGGKPPSSSGGLSISDQRLDPGMVQRRMSSGSIADEQDYSRRILRVTNA